MPERLSQEEAYELLGLEPEPEKTPEEIKKAYKRKSLATHPDKNPVGLACACGSYFRSTFWWPPRMDTRARVQCRGRKLLAPSLMCRETCVPLQSLMLDILLCRQRMASLSDYRKSQA